MVGAGWQGSSSEQTAGHRGKTVLGHGSGTQHNAESTMFCGICRETVSRKREMVHILPAAPRRHATLLKERVGQLLCLNKDTCQAKGVEGVNSQRSRNDGL